MPCWKVFLISLLFVQTTTSMSSVFFTTAPTLPASPEVEATTKISDVHFTDTPTSVTSDNSFTNGVTAEATQASTTTSAGDIDNRSSSPANITTTITVKPELKRGLRCVDKTDPTFVPPANCKLSSNQLLVTRDADGRGFDFIFPQAFDGLYVRLLNLSGLSLKSLDEMSFQGLSGLNTLYLDSNEIEVLPQDVFADLNDLSHLYLHSNQLKTIGAGLLKNKGNLKEISLSNNSLIDIESNSFANQRVVEKLHLDRNKLTSLRKESFQGLSELQELNLGSNMIRTLPTELFASLTFLRSLNLTRNSIQFIPDGLFSTTSEIALLDLSFNEIRDLGDQAFKDKRRLSELYLNDNQLEEIKMTWFGGLDGMSSIYLHNNHISDLRSNSLSGLTQLKNLVLRNNSIRYLPIGWLDAIGNLESVDLSHNAIDKVDAGPFRIPISLKKLDLSFNKLQSLASEWFQTNTKLTELKLRANNLTSLPKDIFITPEKIETLDLGSNRLKQEDLKDMFRNLTSLRILYLDNNSMTTFDADEARCQGKLEELYLNASCLESVRVLGFDRLKRLDLQKNYLQALTSNEISGLTSLQTLDASDNNITNFDFNSSSTYQGLRLLNLSMNLLANVDSSSVFRTSSNQTTFDFSWNSIVDLSTFPDLHRFSIASEHLHCSCSQLPQWKSLPSFVDYKTTACTDGKNLHYLACYLTNPLYCQTRTWINSTTLNDWCSTATPSMTLNTRPIIFKDSCKFPKPEIIDFNLVNTTEGFEVTWNITNINSSKWFSIRWIGESQNSTVSNSVFLPTSNEKKFSTSLSQSGLITVCVATEPVYIFIPKSEQCGQMNFTAPTAKLPEVITNKDIPFWAWIILAFGILLLLLLLILFLAFCIKRSRNKRLEKEMMEEERRKTEMRRAPSFTYPPPDPNLPQDPEEQSTISIDMYINISN